LKKKSDEDIVISQIPLNPPFSKVEVFLLPLAKDRRFIFSIIILLQDNMAKDNIKLHKVAGASLFRTQKGPFNGLEASVFRRNIAAV